MKTRTRLFAIITAAAALLGAGGIVTAASAGPVPTSLTNSSEAVCFMWPNMNFYICI